VIIRPISAARQARVIAVANRFILVSNSHAGGLPHTARLAKEVGAAHGNRCARNVKCLGLQGTLADLNQAAKSLRSHRAIAMYRFRGSCSAPE